ncbi:unnamed protein product [Polarella glacialis]|uniref:Uncharacterized protein n=1 Tax=Polarella glacialis TaxID=89957 RepID=A0A813FIK2_POLGL|nr:unnamed protein product [Polarella glacialis]CAE8650100.1 unnamed protein product [Polarella glacialis]
MLFAIVLLAARFDEAFASSNGFDTCTLGTKCFNSGSAQNGACCFEKGRPWCDPNESCLDHLLLARRAGGSKDAGQGQLEEAKLSCTRTGAMCGPGKPDCCGGSTCVTSPQSQGYGKCASTAAGTCLPQGARCAGKAQACCTGTSCAYDMAGPEVVDHCD